MYKTLEQIKSYFHTRTNGIRQIEDFYTYKTNEEYGVAIENVHEVEINERFANVSIQNKAINYRNTTLNLIVLTTRLMSHKNEFATLCGQFVEHGENYENRKIILNSPLDWWNKWKDLIGNRLYNPNTYHIIAELLALEQLYLKGKENIEWKGPFGSSIDIQTKDETYEIKSSLVRYENEITISSQYQLPKADEDRSLVFYKMELMVGGESINSVMARLKKIESVNINDLEEKLTNLGHIKNRHSRSITYAVHEVRKYKVDSNFPKITADSFKTDQFPNNIKKIYYVINLDNIEYENWQGE